MSLRRSLGPRGLVITSGAQLAKLVLDELGRQGISKSQFGRVCGQSSTTLANVFGRPKSGTSLNVALGWTDALNLRLTLGEDEMKGVVQACQLIDGRRLALDIPIRRSDDESETYPWERIRRLAQGRTAQYGDRILFATILRVADCFGCVVHLRTRPIVSKRNARLAAMGVDPIVVSKLNP